MDLWDEVRVTLISFGIVGVVAITGLVVLARRGVGRLWPIQRLRFGLWTGSTVIGHFLLYAFCSYLTILLVQAKHVEQLFPDDATELRQILILAPLAGTFFLSLSFTLLLTMTNTHVAAAGLSLGGWRRSLFLGLAGFLAITPIVHAVNLACLLRFGQGENGILKIAVEGLREVEWIMLFLQTVVFAPLIEEWLFRGLLQGWLRRAPLLGHAIIVWIAILLGVARSVPDFGFPVVHFLILAVAVAGPYAIGLFLLYRPLFAKGTRCFLAPTAAVADDAIVSANKVDAVADAPTLHPLATDLFAAEGEERLRSPWREFGSSWFRWKVNAARLSILGSSILWALAHPQWPDPIPLVVMGLMLGWLAFRTQNIVPGIIVHALFNLVAFITLFHQTTANGNDEMVAARPSPSPSPAIVKVVPGSWWPRLK